MLLFKNGQYLLLLLTMAAFLLALISPIQNDVGPYYLTLKFMSVCFIYFLSGVLMDESTMHNAARRWKILLFIQTFNFVLSPIFTRLLVAAISYFTAMDQWIINGFTAVACMPSSLCSAIILTKAAGGNVATALFSSIVSTALGTFVTPHLLIAHLGVSSSVPVQRTLAWLVTSAVLPLLAGCLMRRIGAHTLPLPHLNDIVWNFAIFYNMYNSFSGVFREREFTVTAAEFLGIVIIVLTVQMLVMVSSVKLASALQLLDNHYFVPLLFCSSHKTLTFGLGIVKALFGGYAHVSHTCLPLLVYNPVQMILGACVAPIVRARYSQLHINLDQPGT